MPDWVGDDAREYWDAADVYERANGRLYVSADFALPRDLDPDEQVALAHAFAQALTAEERLPYTLAIHAGRDANGQEHNPHAHLMISERHNDGVSRNREQWFRRTNNAAPERGGAPKSRTFHGRDWMEHARERWADLTNATLERNGRHERVDHRRSSTRSTRR
jgi:MobA/MobL family